MSTAKYVVIFLGAMLGGMIVWLLVGQSFLGITEPPWGFLFALMFAVWSVWYLRKRDLEQTKMVTHNYQVVGAGGKSRWFWAVAAVLMVVFIGQLRVSEAATRITSAFVQDQLNIAGKMYTVAKVDVPFNAFMGGTYQVTVRLMAQEAGKVALLRPTVDGNCLWSDCVVSLRNLEIIALE